MKNCGNLIIRSKLWLSLPEAKGVFGDGRWRLLCEIKKQGSLQKAAAALNMSYRKAWGDLKKAEKYLDLKLTNRYRGGNAGGETQLTEKGQLLVKAYRQFRKQANRSINRLYEKYLKEFLI